MVDRLALAKRVNQAYASGGLQGFAALFAELAEPDVVWREDPRFPGAGTFVGVDAVLLHLSEIEDFFRVEQSVDGYELVGDTTGEGEADPRRGLNRELTPLR